MLNSIYNCKNVVEGGTNTSEIFASLSPHDTRTQSGSQYIYPTQTTINLSFCFSTVYGCFGHRITPSVRRRRRSRMALYDVLYLSFPFHLP